MNYNLKKKKNNNKVFAKNIFPLYTFKSMK